ncbi:MAG: 50S ribosomal protein L23 [Chromatiales bacterium]|nr:50S ribosomal protein L23 [Chromatiales bacterium]
MNRERLMTILLAPVVSEKATSAADQRGQYAFKVLGDATKPEVRAAVELMFEVKVDAVQMVNIAGKRKTSRGHAGRRASVRKAYVRLADGQSIDFGVAG